MRENDDTMMTEESGASSRITVRDALYVVFRHKWKIVCTFFTICVLGCLVVYLLPDIYQSEAMIRINTGRDALAKDPEISMPMADTTFNTEAAMRNSIQILQSPTVAERVVAALGADLILQKPEPDSALARFVWNIKNRLAKDPTEGADPAIVEEVKRAIAAGRVTAGINTAMQGNILIVRYETFDPYVAKQVLDKVLDAHQKEQIALGRPAISPEFFQEEVNKAQTAYAAKAKELEDLRTKHKISAMDVQLGQATAAIALVKTSILSVTSQITASEARIKTHRENLSKQPASLTEAQPQVESTLVANLKQQLLNLQVQEADLAQRYPDDAFPLKNVRTQITLTKEALEKEQKNSAAVSIAANPARQQTEMALEGEKANLAGLEASLSGQRQELAAAETELANLRGIESTVKTLEREVSVRESSLLLAQKHLERSRLSETLDDQGVSGVRIFQAAALQTAPVAPNRKRNYAAVLFMAVFCGLGLAFALEYINQSLKTPEDVERHLGLPVLATLSHKEFKSCI